MLPDGKEIHKTNQRLVRTAVLHLLFWGVWLLSFVHPIFIYASAAVECVTVWSVYDIYKNRWWKKK